MFHQSTNGRRKAKCFKVDHAFQLALLLVVGIWFLYQIGQSGEMTFDQGENSKNKIIEDGVAGFGRKVKLNVRNMIETDMGNENFGHEGELMEDGRVGDDELDRNSEEKTDEEVLDKEHDDLGENVENQEGEMDGKEEVQPVADDEDDSYSQMGSRSNGIMTMDEKTEEVQQEADEKDDSDGRMINSSNGIIESSVSATQRKMRNGAQRFADEDGHPKEVSDSTENFMLYRTETADGEASLDQEKVPQSDNRSDYVDNVAPSSDKFSKSSPIDRDNETERSKLLTHILAVRRLKPNKEIMFPSLTLLATARLNA